MLPNFSENSPHNKYPLEQSRAYFKERGITLQSEQVAQLLRKADELDIVVSQTTEYTQAYPVHNHHIKCSSYHEALTPEQSSMIIAIALMAFKEIERLNDYIEEPQNTTNNKAYQWNKIQR